MISVENQQKANKLQKNSKLGTFLSVLILLIIFQTPTLAVENSDSILKMIDTGTQAWIPIVKQACLYVFFSLATINLVWTFGMMALRGFELNEFFTEVIKKIMYIGIFVFLFNVDYWLNTLMQGFIQLGTDVSSGNPVTPSNIISSALQIIKAIWDATGWNIPKTLFLFICGVIILIAFTFMAIDLLLAYIKFYLINIVAFFALALGGLEHFKQIGLNPILTAIKVGIELFLLMAFMALAISSIQNAVVQVKEAITINLILDLLVMSLIFAVISKLIPTVIEAVFQGTIGDSGAASSGFKAVAAMTGGMAVGAVAGTIGATRAIQAAKALHLAEGGKGGMDLVKGVAKNLTGSGAEHLKENLTKGRMPNQMANRLQAKAEDILQKQNIGEISGSKAASEPYQSGVGKG